MAYTTFTAGTKAKASEVNGNLNYVFKLSNERAIAEGATEITVSDQKIIDIFSAAAGANTTVDTVNSTATFDTNRYLCSAVPTTYTQDAEASFSTGGAASYDGYRFLVNSTCYLKTVTKYSSCTATKCRLTNDAGSTIEEVSFVGDVATFTAQTLTSSSYYKIVVHDSGGSYTQAFNGSASYPYTNTYINFTSGWKNLQSGGGTTSTQAFNLVSMDVFIIYVDSYVQSDTATISTSDDKIFVTPLMHEALSGSDAVTFDYSMNNESTWYTGNALNTWIDASGSTNTGTLSIRLQLDTDDGITTPKVSGWIVLTSD